MRNGHLLYVIGQPGSGKSTLLAALTAGLEPLSVESKPFAHIVWGPGVVELGARREAFSGTDALSMSVQPKVLAWFEQEAPAYVIGEGDRLANGKFFSGVLGLGWGLELAVLRCSAAVAEHRRAGRAAALGTKPQNPQWLAGRISKTRTLLRDWAPHLIELEADGPPDTVLTQLITAGNPVVDRLRALVASPT